MENKQVSLSSLAKRRDIFYILILGLIIAIVWVAVGVYTSLNKTTITPNVQKQTIPLSPNIDTKTLQDLNARTFYTKDQLSTFSLNTRSLEDEEKKKNTPLVTPTPPSLSEEANAGIALEPETATEGGKTIQSQ